MEQNLEIEFKSKINYEEHLKLRDFFPFDTPILQENTYYDTKDLYLYSKGIMSRTRKVDDSVLFTLKEPTEEGLLEYEFYVDTDIYSEPHSIKLFSDFGVDVKDLVEVAFSNTVRYTYKDSYGTWCLDITQFKNHKDYEIEYELLGDDPAAHKHFINSLKSVGLDFVPIDPKFVRALNSSTEFDAQDVFQSSDE